MTTYCSRCVRELDVEDDDLIELEDGDEVCCEGCLTQLDWQRIASQA